jgi:putative endonuclease
MARFQYSFVYIMASRKNGTMYVGVTSNLLQRTYQHRNHLVEGFTDKYRVVNLVYFETYDDLKMAIAREKQLKRWRRAWKINLIEKDNPEWKDLFDQLI